MNAGAALAAMDVVKNEPERRQQLLCNAKGIREKLNGIGFNTAGSESQIIPLVTGQITETTSLAAKLWHEGILAPAIRPPTVPEGSSRLRFSIMSSHTSEDLRRLIEGIIN